MARRSFLAALSTSVGVEVAGDEVEVGGVATDDNDEDTDTGGGGGGWKGCCGARSGHVKYKTFTVTKNHTRVVMTVGRGGYGGYDGESGAGQISEVYIDKDGPDQQYWSVNGGML